MSVTIELGSAPDDIESARRRLLDPRAGYVVYKGLFQPHEARGYRAECDRFMATGTRIHHRINVDLMPDYIHPRSHDAVERTYRLYQFFHNRRSASTDALLDSAIALRDRIEQPWTRDAVYLAERRRLQDYIIVTKYVAGTGQLPKHNDYQGNMPFPFVQFLVLLSRPGIDYRGGELLLYPKEGRRLGIQSDLGLGEGDALLFDKTLFHEVEPTLAAETDVGRWSVLIGARAPRDSWVGAAGKALLHHESVHEGVAAVRRRLRALVARWR